MGAIAALATGIIVLNGVLKTVTIVQEAAAAAQKLLNFAMAANPIGIVIVLIAALVAGLVWFFTQTKTGRKIVAGAWAGIQAAIEGVTNWWKDKAWPTIRAVWNLITGAFQQGKDKVAGFLRGVVDVVKTVWSYSPLGLIINNWGAIVDWVKGIPGRVGSALGNLAGTLYNAGSSIISGFLNGLVARFNAVKDFVSGIGSWIAANKGPKAYDLGLLVKNGGWIMQGLRTGIEGDLPRLKQTLGAVARTVSGTDLGALEASASASTSAAAAAARSGSGSASPPIVLSFQPTGDSIFDAFLEELMKHIRVNGGNVQGALT